MIILNWQITQMKISSLLFITRMVLCSLITSSL